MAYFDARYDTPLPRQNLIKGPVLIDEGVDRPRVIAPNDIWRSIALMRISTLDGRKMPPLAHETLDVEGRNLLRSWIDSLPGPPVLAPPLISPLRRELPKTRGGESETKRAGRADPLYTRWEPTHGIRPGL